MTSDIFHHITLAEEVLEEEKSKLSLRQNYSSDSNAFGKKK